MPSIGSDSTAPDGVVTPKAPPAEATDRPDPRLTWTELLRILGRGLRNQFQSATTLTARQELIAGLVLGVIAGVGFYFSTTGNQNAFDYTTRIAAAMLHGHLGISNYMLSWLNELVPRNNIYYSVFPLGAVLSMMPVALLQVSGLIKSNGATVVASVIAAAVVYFFFRLSSLHPSSLARRGMLALFPVFGCWTWCNLGFAGAWQIALGMAVLGEVGALYLLLIRRQFLGAGFFFALAFGNRTELILTAPLFFYLCWKADSVTVTPAAAERARWHQIGRRVAIFSVAPVLLGIATLAYNYMRFGSIFDFGYSHIPGVLREPWYQHGLFSLRAMPYNAHKMLFEGMDDIPTFPYLRPHAFGCSIFIASPFLFLLFREGSRFRAVCWTAIALLIVALWCHGNPGGWQFSYRYGMILLPWMFLLILTNGPARFSGIELGLFLASLAVNGIAIYQLQWAK